MLYMLYRTVPYLLVALIGWRRGMGRDLEAPMEKDLEGLAGERRLWDVILGDRETNMMH